MDVHGVVDHVGVVEELDLGLQDVVVVVQLALLEELEQREHQVPVQIRSDPRGEVVGRHCSRLGFSRCRGIRVGARQQ